MLIDEIVAKHVRIHRRGMPRIEGLRLIPFNCPKCGMLICGNLAFYCNDECELEDQRGSDWSSGCNNECCGDVDEIYDIFKSRYTDLTDYAHKWWNRERPNIIGQNYQEYSASAYIVKMVNILWCLDQKYHFSAATKLLEDGLFEI
jgi:hypothetical protein